MAEDFTATDPLKDAYRIEEAFEAEGAEDPDGTRMELVDQKTIADLDQELADSLSTEGGDPAAKMAALWDDLSPMERQVALDTSDIGGGATTNRSTRFINKKLVPRSLHLRWIAPDMVHAGFGMRGYTPVRRDQASQKWVPNARTFGTAKVFVAGGAVLCSKPKKEWLRTVVQEHQAVNSDRIQEWNAEYMSALSKVKRKLGARRVTDDREHDGISLVRGPDPEGPGDRVRADSMGPR